MPAWMTSGGARICGFEVRGGVEAVTQGIDLWSKPYIIKRRDGSKMCLILMDTQGLWDKKTLNSFNCILFGLSSVLSSYAIFNQKKNMNTEQLKQLANLAMMSKELVSDGRKRQFQHLDIMLRDYENYSLKKDTLETCEDKRRKRLNQLKTSFAERGPFEHVESCFQAVDLMCLIDPGEDVRDLEYDGLISEIKPKFLQLLSQHIQQVVNAIEPLKVNGEYLKGRDFEKWVRGKQ